ncbi:MAG: DNA repair protein RecO, partial [Phycisphaerae bacterium]
ATLTEFQQQAFSTLPTNLFAFNCCLFAAELLNKLTHDYDPHPGLFDSFLQFLQDVNEGRGIPASAGTGLPLRRQEDEGRETLSLLILFQLTLLREIGLMPILNACANCNTQYAIRNHAPSEVEGTRYEIYFSSSANGLVCRDCEAGFPDKIRLTRNAALCLTDLKRIAESDEKTLNEIEQVLIYHFTELLGHRPKMTKYILKT